MVSAVFVTPDKTIGSSNDLIVYQSPSATQGRFAESGTIDDARDKVLALCRGNSRLVLAVCVGLAGPILFLTGDESGGFHLKGGSSIGKSTSAYVGASLYGSPDYLKSWRATINGLEGVAEAFNDRTLFLDEINEAKPDDVIESAYMLANGRGKSRATKSGGMREIPTWRLLFLSNGEISLADHARRALRSATAGQEVRVLDIPAAVADGFGSFENLHGFDDGDVFARHLRSVTSEYHGVAGRVWIETLAQHFDESKKLALYYKERFAKLAALDPMADGQVKRALNRFAVVSAAGELATRYGITGWSEGEAEKGTQACFNAWLEQRGNVGAHEPEAIRSRVRLFFQQHGDARFTDWDGYDSATNKATINRAGFKRTFTDGAVNFYMLSEVFKTEMCAGFDRRAVVKVLLDQGWLIPAPDRAQQVHKLPGVGKKVRCYVFSSDVLGDE